MTYQLLLHYPGEDLFFPTNHTSDDVDALWRLAAGDVPRAYSRQQHRAWRLRQRAEP